jgi:hypothetical protein
MPRVAVLGTADARAVEVTGIESGGLDMSAVYYATATRTEVRM